MKYVFTALLSLMLASLTAILAACDGGGGKSADPRAASESVVHWPSIAGVITAQDVDNPVADIDSGTFAWTTSDGEAAVDLNSGAVFFQIEGLVINGTMFSGTPGPVTEVIGSVVCNPGQADNGNSTEAVYSTTPVPLSADGNAGFSGSVGSIKSPCDNPLFLVRISQPAGALGRWIATGGDPSFGNHLFDDE